MTWLVKHWHWFLVSGLGLPFSILFTHQTYVQIGEGIVTLGLWIVAYKGFHDEGCPDYRTQLADARATFKAKKKFYKKKNEERKRKFREEHGI